MALDPAEAENVIDQRLSVRSIPSGCARMGIGQDQSSILDLVQPAVARRRLVYQARELRLDPLGWSRCCPHAPVEHTLRLFRDQPAVPFDG
jgi:hypothetical protein